MLFFALIIMGALRMEAQTVVVNSLSAPDNDGSLIINSSFYGAQGFTVGAADIELTSITLSLYSGAEGVGATANISIRDNSDNTLGNLIENLGNLSTSTSTINDLTINSTTSPTLSANTSYWVHVTYVSGADTNWDASTGATNTGAAGTIPANFLYYNASVINGYFVDFKVEGTLANRNPAFTSTAVTAVDDDETYTYEIETSDADDDHVVVTAPTKPDWLTFTAGSEDAVVTTFVGSGTLGTDDGTGADASFYSPVSIGADGAGNIYELDEDEGSYQIRKITSAGVVTTLVSASGYEDGPLVSAKFNSPNGIAVDNAGNVYVADTWNHKIRKISTDGTVSTLAGSTQGYLDDTGTSARFDSPYDVAVDNSGNVYVADRGNEKIRKVTPAGVVTSLAGSTNGDAVGTGTAAQFNWPEAIALDNDGNVYVADRNHKIKKITQAGEVTLLAGSTSGYNDGVGAAAQFYFPHGMDFDAAGNMYLAELFNHRIRKIAPDGTVTTLAGNGSEAFGDGTGTAAKFARPFDLTFDSSGDLYIADGINYRIRKIDITHPAVLSGDAAGQVGDHSVILSASDGNGGTATQTFTITVTDATAPVFTSGVTASFAENGTGTAYTAVATDSETITYSLGTGNDESLFDIVGSTGVVTFSSAPDFENPADADANNAYVVNVVASDGINSANQDVTITVTNVNEQPAFTSTAVTAVDDDETYTYGIETSDLDNDAVTVTATVKPDWLSLNSVLPISIFAGSGDASFADGNGTAASFIQPVGLVMDASDNLYVATYGHRIRKITPAGDVSTLAGSGDYGSANGTGTAASFANPTGMTMDASGNLFVADFGNQIIRKITPSGEVSIFAGTNGVRGNVNGTGTDARFSGPISMAIDASGNLYVAEIVNNLIRKITPAGEVSTFAGSGFGTPADGTGTDAGFNGPNAIDIDASGNLYVTEQNSHLVRKITPAGVVTTIAGTGSAGANDGTGTSASFNTPFDVLVDGSGNLLISEYGNHTIRKITPSGVVTTIAGSSLIPGSDNGAGTAASFNGPIGLAMNAAGEVFVADQGNSLIRKIGLNSYQLAGDATGQAGNHNVTLSASDGNGGTATQSFVVDVSRVLIPDVDNILYVNKSVSGGNGRGGSWANAITELADAMIWAKENYDNSWETTPLKIYVSIGTYQPMYSPEDGVNFGTDQARNNSFSMVKNVQLYGGFDPANGIEDLTDTRILPSSDQTKGTILNGDIGTENDASDNIYNVLVSSGNVGTASLDGFSLTGGNANAYSDILINGNQVYNCSGAGVYNSVSSPSYKNVIVHNNTCTESGGGMFSYQSSPKLQLVILRNNEAKDGGGMTNQESSSPTLLNVSIESNQASENGSGMYNVDLSGPTLTNVSIVGNEATVSSEEVPGCVSQNSGVTLYNSIIWDVVTGDYTAQNCLIKGNSDTSDGNIDASGLTDTDIFNDPANEDFSLKNTSSAVNTGSNSLYTNAGGDIANDVDLGGNPRLYDGLPSIDVIDMGAYEYLDNITPVFTSALTASFAENGTGTAYTALATDANALTYSLGTGNDESLFDIVGSSGVVTFKNAPDFENPTDADANNSYVINVVASDGINTTNQDVTITVTDVDDTAPVFTSALTASFGENGTGTAYTALATDANALTYSLGTGNDESLFDIVGSTGVVTFKTAPDFENPADEDANNTYVINVVASDGTNASNQDVTITVTDVDDTAPVFTSALTASFAENGTGTAYTALATDANSLTYSLGSGNDESLFDIVGSTGVVTFKTAPDFENPADADANNTYVINVVASDGTNASNQDVTIMVTDVDDTAPVFTSALTASFAENGTGTAYTALATDANALTYSLGTGNDESLFDIVGSTGVVTFKTAPDFENPADADANNTYVINVVASDGTNASNQDVTIMVTDVDDTAPVFTSALTASFAENGTGTAYTATATDSQTITYSLGAGNDESLFNIVGSTGVVTFKTTPDFENPTDADANNTYVINVVASDGTNASNQDVTITVTDVDDTAPVFTSALTASFAENGTGTAYTALATDASALTYSLGTGNDESLFDIVGSTGVVTFKSAPDFENPTDADANNTYVINVVASDGTSASNQDVTITVTDVDDTAPVFTSALTASFAENGTGTAYTALATDASALTYSLGAGNDESLFDIVGSTGVVTFKTAPDFENPADADANNTYVINVVASDGTNASNQVVTITVTDVDDTAPVFTSALTASFAENGTGTAYTALATDANSLTYSLGSSNDESLFDIVGSTGVVTFKSAPDFENPADADANNTYVINVLASDGINTANQDVTITVTDVDDTAPVFTSALTASFAENGTGTAYTALATDASALTYSLGTGNDESLFDIVGSTGVVTFKTAPDFENPADAGANNTYVINVVASDGSNASNQDVTITVTDVDDTAPVFTSALTASFAENGTGTAYTATATGSETITYSLGTGNDESLFDIVGSTGVVTFKSAPDFENPADADANNTYLINVVASDGVNASNQDVTIMVTDVEENTPVADIMIPTAITPNGDGANDQWQLPGIEFFPNSRVAVLDRNGHVVFESKGYTTPWDGTDNGRELAADTYYYSVDLTRDGGKTHKGFVLILK